MKIYFAGSMRAGKQDAPTYARIIEFLKAKGTVLTEHVSDTVNKDLELATAYAFKRDLEWLSASDMIIAEVTVPSLGVGYELAIAEKPGKKVV